MQTSVIVPDSGAACYWPFVCSSAALGAGRNRDTNGGFLNLLSLTQADRNLPKIQLNEGESR